MSSKFLNILFLISFTALILLTLSCSKDKSNIKLPSEKSYTVKSIIAQSWKSLSDSAKSEYLKGWKQIVKNSKFPVKDSYIPSEGFVPDEETAIKIAEVIWLRIYGESIYETKPFFAVLIDGKIWRVSGTLPPGFNGGTPFAEIRKSDGKIIQVLHGK